MRVSVRAVVDPVGSALIERDVAFFVHGVRGVFVDRTVLVAVGGNPEYHPAFLYEVSYFGRNYSCHGRTSVGRTSVGPDVHVIRGPRHKFSISSPASRFDILTSLFLDCFSDCINTFVACHTYLMSSLHI